VPHTRVGDFGRGLLAWVGRAAESILGLSGCFFFGFGKILQPFGCTSLGFSFFFFAGPVVLLVFYRLFCFLRIYLLFFVYEYFLFLHIFKI
jgi:hypothetical protein